MIEDKTIRIYDKANGIIVVTLSNILEYIENPNSFIWSILFLEAIGHLDHGKSILSLEQEINNSEKGLTLSWSELKSLAKKFDQVINILIIGVKDKKFLHRYINDNEMHANCDIVIEMVDSFYWEIHSKDMEFIKNLSIKFKQITKIQ